jgi:hypothetical protein
LDLATDLMLEQLCGGNRSAFLKRLIAIEFGRRLERRAQDEARESSAME